MLNRTTLPFSRLETGLFFIAALVAMAAWWWTPETTAGLLLNTVQLAVCVLLTAVPVAAALAYGLVRCHVPGRRFWEACLLLLLFLPLYIQLAAWEAGFGRGGWYSTLVAQKLSDPPLEGFRGAVIVHAVASIPWLFWIFRLGLRGVPTTYEDAARLEAGPWQVLTRITIPLMLPTVLAGGFYVSIVTATEITVTDRYQFRSYAEEIYNEYALSTSLSALPLGVAPVIAFMAAVTTMGLAACRLVWPTLVHPTHDPPQPPAKKNWWAFTLVGLVVGGLLFVPVANLIYQAGLDVRLDGDRRTRVWSIGKFLSIVGSSPGRYRYEFAWTLLFCQLSTLSALTAATLCAWWARRVHWRQYLCACLAVICFVTPGTFVGLSLIWVLNRPAPSFLGMLYQHPVFAPWLAMSLRSFPFAYLVLWYGLRSIPQTLFDSAEVDGATSGALLRFMALPLLTPSLICAGLVCLAVSAGELTAGVLVMPPGVTTVATEIFNLVHYGAEDQLSGLCLSYMALIVLLSVLIRTALQRMPAAQ